MPRFRLRRFAFRLLLGSAALLLAGWLLRGPLYRHFIHYQAVGPRPTYAVTDPQLRAYFDREAASLRPADVRDVIGAARRLTSDCLSYRTVHTTRDPNQLIRSRRAHCVGYAAFFSTACNYLLRRHGHAGWTARPVIGQLYCGNTNLHRYFASPFFRDHDFAVIENTATGERLYVDPTVSDYLQIDYVRGQL